MPRIMRAVALPLLLMGCDLEPEVTRTTPETPEHRSETAITVEELVGVWRVEGLTASDCPAEWQRAMPMGETTWRAIDDHLVISATMGETPPAELWPTGDNSLERTLEVSFFGCTATEAILLTIAELEDSVARGTYSATLSHDGSEACQEMSREAGLPERCETTMSWNARRLSGL